MHTKAERIIATIGTVLVAVVAFQDITLMASRFDNQNILWFYLIPAAIALSLVRKITPAEHPDPNEMNVNNSRRVP